MHQAYTQHKRQQQWVRVGMKTTKPVSASTLIRGCERFHVSKPAWHNYCTVFLSIADNYISVKALFSEQLHHDCRVSILLLSFFEYELYTSDSIVFVTDWHLRDRFSFQSNRKKFARLQEKRFLGDVGLPCSLFIIWRPYAKQRCQKRLPLNKHQNEASTYLLFAVRVIP